MMNEGKKDYPKLFFYGKRSEKISFWKTASAVRPEWSSKNKTRKEKNSGKFSFWKIKKNRPPPVKGRSLFLFQADFVIFFNGRAEIRNKDEQKNRRGAEQDIFN